MTYNTPKELFTGICDAIRKKDGTTASINHQDIPTRIEAIETDVLLEEKIVSPSESSTTVTASEGYDGLSQVTVNAIDSNYIGSGIARRTSSNLSVSGATVSVPSGYYASTASKSVSTATQATPSITVGSNGLITASATQSSGYVSSGTKSSTKQLTTQGATTITPGTSSKTAVNSGVYTTGTIIVEGDSDLIAKNIKSGVSIFGVTGNPYVIYTYNSNGATTNDIKRGKEAYVNGDIVEGSLTYVDPDGEYSGGTPFMKDGNSYIHMSYSPSSEFIVGGDYPLTIGCPSYEFGNAEASEVANGKTFTSSAGLAVTGTGMIGKNGQTTSKTVNTGLSEIKYFAMYVINGSSIDSTGMLQFAYETVGYGSAIYCTNASTKFCSVYNSTYDGTLPVSISGGNITWNGTGNMAFISGKHYNWIAIGY